MGFPTGQAAMRQKAAGITALAALPTPDEVNSAYAAIGTRIDCNR